MAADLITLDEAKQFLGFKGQDSQDQFLPSIITACCELIRKYCGLNFDQRPYTETRNGNGRQKLFAFQKPIATSPAPTVQENGVNLVVATGYNTGADVIFDPVSGAFMRMPGTTVLFTGQAAPNFGRWSQGIQNVLLSYTAGYTTGSGGSMPEDLKMLTKYLVGHAWKEANRKEVGVAKRSFGQGSIDLLKDLPPFYHRILEAYSRPVVPEP